MSIGSRFKSFYELRGESYLLRRIPVIIRIDGNAFHTLTKKCEKPFDNHLSESMEHTAIKLCEKIQGVKCAYSQSDEISILLTDFDTLNTEAWFGYRVSKLESVSASMAASYFTIYWGNGKKAMAFASVARNYPKEEVCNYFHWRQIDWLRNSIQMYARSVFSHKQLHNKNRTDMHEMLYEKGMNWANLPDRWKNGIFICKENGKFKVSYNTIFKDDRNIIDKYM
jgi:tRNA(His) 5'-end guanylyltransferase